MAEIKLQTDYFMRHFKDDPRFLSGWNHIYFCDDDGGRLIFDIERPEYHECQVCGRVYTGFVYDSAHTTMLRTDAAINAVKAAFTFACGRDAKYLDYMKSIVEFYANNYMRFPNIVKPLALDDAPRTGRIMTQAADEAIFIVRLLSALEIVKPALDKSWIAAVKQNMFDKAHDQLKSMRNSISCSACWINAALGIMGFFFGEEGWIDEALTDELGLYEQIEKGVTPEGFWHVGSIHHNFIVLEGITSFFAFANAYGFETAEFSQQIVMYMYDACFKYAFDNGALPSAGDNWPGVSLKSYTHCFCLACKAFGTTMKKYLRHIETLNLQRVSLPLDEPFYFDNRMPLEKLLFAPSDDEAANEKRLLPKRVSKTYERANQVMLRNGVFNVFLKYGHESPQNANAHYDKMSVEIMTGMRMLTRDSASTGYMAKMLNDWYKSGMAHSTCVVDGMRSDIKNPGRLVYFDTEKVVAECEPYEGIIFRRSIDLKDNSLLDDFVVEFAEGDDDETEPGRRKAERRIEWFFHFNEPIGTSHIKTVPTKALRGVFFINPREIDLEGKKVLSFSIGGGIATHIRIFENMRAFICKTAANPADRLLDTVILQVMGHGARFKTEIRCAKE